MHLCFPKVFLTVGTTEFEGLVDILAADSSHSLVNALADLYGCKHIVVQIGRGQCEPYEAAKYCQSRGVTLEWYRFKDSIRSDITTSDLVISHCGAGTILEVLKLNKPLIVVVNETLQANHQTELADALSAGRYCHSTIPQELCALLSSLHMQAQSDVDASFVFQRSFPAPDLMAFPNAINEMFEDEEL